MNKFKGHLHVHTEYSPLDGLASIEELVIKAKELKQEFIAITDHGSSSGLYDCKRVSEAQNFKIILGEEFYFDNEDENLKTGHLIILAKNQQGLRNLFKLQRLAYNNVYYKPRITLDMLKEYNEGLICTTACIANKVGQHILNGSIHLALAHIIELKNIFKDDFYIELQSATNEDVITVNKALIGLCEDYDFKPILTNDVHYVEEEDYKVHEVLLCMQQKAKMSSTKRWKFEQNDYWLKSEEEMLKYTTYFPNKIIERCFNNITEINEKCETTFMEYGNYLPKWSDNEDADLELAVQDGYKGKLIPRNEDNEDFEKDLKRELTVIKKTGYSGYFLIVKEYINWAKKNGILVGDGRGSGAGSKVAYTIDITEVNPQKHNLLFERFLDYGRTPDFDVDFSDIDAVFKHLQDKYGRENVARVGAFSRFTTKQALKKTLSAFGYSFLKQNEISKLLPAHGEYTLKEVLEKNKELKDWFKDKQNIVKIISKLENKLEHFSTHAGGVIICDNLTEILPVLTDSKDRSKLVVGLDKIAIEDLGHYKFDILGLSSLSLMKNVTNYTGKINWHEVDFNDEEVYKMLSKGDVTGVFQLSEQREKTMEQSPRNFDDLVALNALIRPGVCDWHEYIRLRHEKPVCKEKYMECTHGLIVFQDQYLELARTYAGWSIAFADKHIRKNKQIKDDEELKKKWLKDSNGNEELWEEIVNIVAGGYGFNKAHSTSYARLSFQTAYCKRYYPKEFYAALLTQHIGETDKTVEIIHKLKQESIKILPPDVNKSKEVYVPSEDGILIPLTAIGGVGGSALKEIHNMLPIKDFDDFLERRVKKTINKRTTTSLIKAGAFNFDGRTKTEMLELVDKENEVMSNEEYERSALGFYLTSTPFDKYTITPVSTQNPRNILTIIEVTSLVEKYDKKGKLMAFATGINSVEALRLIVFSSVWRDYQFEPGDMVLIRGRLDGESIIVNSLEKI